MSEMALSLQMVTMAYADRDPESGDCTAGQVLMYRDYGKSLLTAEMMMSTGGLG